jgi:hypothetical protein
VRRSVEEDAALGSAFFGIIGLPIDVLLDVVGGGEGAGFGEVGGEIGLGLGFGVDLLDEGFGENAFGEKRLLEELDGILGIAVFLDLLAGAVGLVGVGDGVAAVTVGVDLDDGGLVFFAGEGEELVHRGADFVNVVAEARAPVHAIGFGAFGETGTGGGALLRSAHGVAVVLDDEDNGEIPERGEVVGLVDGALVDGTITHERHCGTFEFFVFEGVGETGAEGDLSADDAVAAPVVKRRGEVVHGAALALGATGDLAVELGHEGFGVHADGHRVSMISIRGDDVVVFAHQRTATDGDGFLSDIEMEKAADLLGLVGAQGTLFKTTDAHHLAVELDLGLLGEIGIDRSRGGLADGGGFGFGGRCCFFAHRWSRVEC